MHSTIATNTRRCGFRALVLLCGLSATLSGQAVAPQTGAIPRFKAPWITVFTDSGFRIALDTSRIKRADAKSYLLWMQTRWLTPRRGSTKRTPSPFNREFIHTFLQCEPLAYKVARTVVSLDDGPPIDSLGGGVDTARRASWRPASRGSADARAGAEACRLLTHGLGSVQGPPKVTSERPPPNER